MNEEFSDDFEVIENWEMLYDSDNVKYSGDHIVEDPYLENNSFGNVKENVDISKIKDESDNANKVTEADSTSKFHGPHLFNNKEYLITHTTKSFDHLRKCLVAIAVFTIGFGIGHYVGSSKGSILKHIEEELKKDLNERFNFCFDYLDKLQAQLEEISVHYKKQTFLDTNLTKSLVENEFKALMNHDKQMLKLESSQENLQKNKFQTISNSAEHKNMNVQSFFKLKNILKSSQNFGFRKDVHSSSRNGKEMKPKAIKYLMIELQRFLGSLTEDSFYKLQCDDIKYYRQEFSQLWKSLTNHKLQHYEGGYHEFDGLERDDANSNRNLLDYPWASCQKNWWRLLEESHYFNFNSLKKQKKKVFSKLKLDKCISFYEFWQLKVICNIIHSRREIHKRADTGDTFEPRLKDFEKELCSELCEMLPMNC